jgi:hypothetical protein
MYQQKYAMVQKTHQSGGLGATQLVERGHLPREERARVPIGKGLQDLLHVDLEVWRNQCRLFTGAIQSV